MNRSERLALILGILLFIFSFIVGMKNLEMKKQLEKLQQTEYELQQEIDQLNE